MVQFQAPIIDAMNMKGAAATEICKRIPVATRIDVFHVSEVIERQRDLGDKLRQAWEDFADFRMWDAQVRAAATELLARDSLACAFRAAKHCEASL